MCGEFSTRLQDDDVAMRQRRVVLCDCAAVIFPRRLVPATDSSLGVRATGRIWPARDRHPPFGRYRHRLAIAWRRGATAAPRGVGTVVLVRWPLALAAARFRYAPNPLPQLPMRSTHGLAQTCSARSRRHHNPATTVPAPGVRGINDH